MKAKLITSLFAVAFIIFVGFGWSVVENPTPAGIVLTIAYFLGLLAGTKIVNKYAE